ncbi:MAG: DUF2851 family protein [Bacteroidota bacterium]|jgi:hypothetical protein
MTEDFLHYVWKTSQFDKTHLITNDGSPLQVLDTGTHNKDAGPDFFNAQVKIAGQLWVGNVEIHLKTTDWLRHGHQYDEAYKNVVLHVVYDHDAIRKKLPAVDLPTLALRGRIQDNLYARYQRFLLSEQWVPCASKLGQVPDIIKTGWQGRLLAERLEAKAQLIRTELEHTAMDWEQAFYRILLRTFGMRVNAEPFSWLARTMPWSLLARKHDQPEVLEALLLGQAGLLPEIPPDAYCRQLLQTYSSLCRLHNLTPQPGHNWKHLRMRPANFPALRLVQLAALMHKTPRLFSTLLHCETPAQAMALFAAEPQEYWHTHYMPGVEAPFSRKRIGEQMLQIIIINVVIPFLFVRGQLHHDDLLTTRALNWLEDLAPESNQLIANWQRHHWKAHNAADSQSLIHLHKNYCSKKQCLHCTVGRYLLEAPDKIKTMKLAG